MVQKKIILAGFLILLVLVTTQVNAQSDIALADMRYEEAQELYDQGNCKNASYWVEQAYNLYSKHNNQPGMNKCNDLDSEINKCLKDQGRNKYQEAASRLREYEYDAARVFALEAKELFALIPDQTRITQCDELIQQIDKEIAENLEFRADNFYNDALDFYNKQDYLTALEKAKKAKELYSQVPKPEGVQKCDTLLDNIGIDMEQVKAKANLYYTYADDWYVKAKANPIFKNFNTAIGYAKSASQLYSLVNDSAGYSSCQVLIKFLQGEIEGNEDRLKNEAKGYYNLAESEYLEGRRYFHEAKYELAYELFKNASTHSGTAQEIYTELHRWANDLYNQQKIKYYKGKVNECTEQQDKINSLKNTIEQRKRAEILYKQAQELRIKAFYVNASVAVRIAKNIFEGIQDWSAVSKCVTLIQDIDYTLEIKNEADIFYENASQNFQVANFANATYYLEKAKEIYQSINKQDAVAKCDSFLEEIKEGNRSKTRANKFFTDAQDLHERGTFTKSNDNARKAKEIYQRINFSEGVSQCDELISSNEEMLITVKEKEELYRNIIIFIISLVVILLVARWWWEKKKKEELIKTRQELDQRRTEALRKEKEAKEREKEEQRKRQLKDEREKIREALEAEKR